MRDGILPSLQFTDRKGRIHEYADKRGKFFTTAAVFIARSTELDYNLIPNNPEIKVFGEDDPKDPTKMIFRLKHRRNF